jgi:hypothetical protein
MTSTRGVGGATVISTCAEAIIGASSAPPAMHRLKTSAFPLFFIFQLLQNSDDSESMISPLQPSTLVRDRRLTPARRL